jgi:hypothetical protein
MVTEMTALADSARQHRHPCGRCQGACVVLRGEFGKAYRGKLVLADRPFAAEIAPLPGWMC